MDYSNIPEEISHLIRQAIEAEDYYTLDELEELALEQQAMLEMHLLD
jgi:hypothetical protein